MIASICGYLVHAYTASGALWGFLALRATLDNDLRQALLWLVLATFVDATDGVLARFVDITRTAPLIDGSRLDEIVDYLTYVVVPGVIVWHVPLVPPTLATPVVGAILASSACGFARRDAKTADHLFTGFPSYWNIVVVYLLGLSTPPGVNAALLLVLAVLVLVPIRYVYPSRTTTLMKTTVVFGTVWAVQMLAMIWTLPSPPRLLTLSALLFPVYYTVLSFWITARRAMR
jgi:phosphatidylcholine synthase